MSRAICAAICYSKCEPGQDPDAAVALANPAPGLQIKHPDWRLLRLVLHQPGPAPSGAKPVPVCWFSATPEPIPAKMHKDVTVRLANDSDWPQWEALFREYRISQIPGGSPPFTDDKTATDAVWALCADAPPHLRSMAGGAGCWWPIPAAFCWVPPTSFCSHDPVRSTPGMPKILKPGADFCRTFLWRQQHQARALGGR